ALAIGDQASIERDDWDLFRRTGVSHLVAISGLHVTMFAWLAGAAVGWAWRRSSRLMLWLPAPAARRWGGLAAAIGYAVLAGWGVPAQRTVWMIACVVGLRGAGLRWPGPAMLLAAAVVVAALDPWALLQPGFWLSFVAVGLLFVSEPALRPGSRPQGWRARWRAALGGGLRTQFVASIGLAPLTLIFFQQLSIVGFVANLLAIPLVTLVVTPLALAGIVLPPLWTLGAASVQMLMAWLGWLGHLPFAVWIAAAAPPWAVAAGLLGGVLAVLPLPPRLRWLGLPLMLPLLAPPVERPPEGRFELVAVDVGQGTAALLRTRRHLLVYDAGPRYSAETDAGERVLLPLLRARGEGRIDMLVLSHRDGDHVGGARSLIEAGGVAEIRHSLEPGNPLLELGPPQRPCEAGQSWNWDGVRFEFVYPNAAERAAARKPNGASCVLRVAGANGSVLLTADIEAAHEAALLGRGAALQSEVLFVPHHGSKTSSTPEFIAAVAPRVALVQAGYRSRYGHPAPSVIQRYRAFGIEPIRSDRCGAWTLPAEGAPRCERQAARRYWHHAATAGG
ncbi:MAG: DNA internalization-related competence protein ComEC/Rec2, partial [Burkholderiales bacterium]|nr:DNA internalization-related competence protein ComEC/Rec2 [Burkholderiales bacterium]